MILVMSGKLYFELKVGGIIVVYWILFEEYVLLGLIIVLMDKDLLEFRELELEIFYWEYNCLVGIVELIGMKNFLGKKI